MPTLAPNLKTPPNPQPKNYRRVYVHMYIYICICILTLILRLCSRTVANVNFDMRFVLLQSGVARPRGHGQQLLLGVLSAAAALSTVVGRCLADSPWIILGGHPDSTR